MTGAQAVVESLKKESVEIIFGYPGGAVLTLYDALYESEYPHILTRHEQGAIHAADGYARATGKPGVVMATSGPGATNLVTGIATAYMDSIPLVIITGQVAVSLIGRDSFQEADIRGITTPITKHNYLVKKVDELPKVLKEAFHIATTGRPGPVVVDIAKDVFAAEIDFYYPEKVELRGYHPLYEGDEGVLERLAVEMEKARKPLLFVGGGVNLSDTAPEVRALVELTGFPLITSLMGLGAVSDDHPLNFGLVGMHGTYAANMATTECDLLIGIGVRFDDRVTGLLEQFAPKAKVVHFDIDAAEINKNVRTDIRVLGHLKWSLSKLVDISRDKFDCEAMQEQMRPWLGQLNEWRSENPLSYEARAGQVMPQAVIEIVDELTQGDAVIVTDVGQNQMWAAQFYHFKNPRSWLTSGGLGTMGYGLPAGLGAQVGCPNKKVVVITGDGGLMMNCQELDTVAKFNLPVKIMVLNNQVLGMVAQWQRMFYGGRYAHTNMEGRTDLVKLAEAMGVPGMRVTQPDEVRRTLQEALAMPGPVLVDFRIPSDEDVMPMVPGGARLDQMVMGGK